MVFCNHQVRYFVNEPHANRSECLVTFHFQEENLLLGDQAVVLSGVTIYVLKQTNNTGIYQALKT